MGMGSVLPAGWMERLEGFRTSQPSADSTDTSLPKRTTDEEINRRAGTRARLGGYVLSVWGADWNAATQQMCFYCTSDPVVTFSKSGCRVLVLTSKLSPDNLLLRQAHV